MGKILVLIVGYLGLLSVIWLHEVGHALFYFKYGCKSNPFKVSVKPYIFFSTPWPVDLIEVEKLTKWQECCVSIAGILVNLLCGGTIYSLYKNHGTPDVSNYVELFFYLFTVFHFIEAISYMVLNNIIVASDIKGIEDYQPWLRLPLFLVGLSCCYILYDLIKMSPEGYDLMMTWVVGIVSFSMGVARILFSKFSHWIRVRGYL